MTHHISFSNPPKVEELQVGDRSSYIDDFHYVWKITRLAELPTNVAIAFTSFEIHKLHPLRYNKEFQIVHKQSDGSVLAVYNHDGGLYLYKIEEKEN